MKTTGSMLLSAAFALSAMAFLPANDQSLLGLANSDPDSKLGPALSQSADKLLLNVNQTELINLFIPDGTQAAKDKVVANYRAEPAIPFTNTVALTSAGFGSVEKVYIKAKENI